MSPNQPPAERCAPRDRAPTSTRWRTVEEAAAILGVKVITLRRSLDRNARRAEDGTTEARVDGLRARKIGRQWRVLLGAGWLPEGPH